MSEAIAARSVEFMLSNSGYYFGETNEKYSVGFYGGEPLLNFRTIKYCIDYVKSKSTEIAERTHFSMTTNFTAVTREVMEYLVDNNVSVLVSLDGPEEMNDRYRKTKGGTGTFRNVMKNIERLRKMNSEYFKKKLGFSIVLAPPCEEIKVSIISGLKAFCELMSKKPNVLEFMKEERSQPIIDLVFRFIKERRK